MIQILFGLLTFFSGALITMLAARKYYEMASQDLRKEANELHRLNILILRALEKAGFAEFNRDKNGNIIGMVINLSAHIKASSTTSKIRLDLTQ